ncbi:ABC transporter ATP-binding protein [Methanobrevibacter sp.]|uniref:ABC transporter ATP-binding protein n=1 Tax=Methanobrevibacter sp. TaxID=66852 RepID=UPI0025E26BA8|nr:ABC transporter ATP-binding protein [Methanobrevibacter sp.]MEE0024646.1 ABC transporter ATP-binding protein [Methanobrevibacter sp.]
MTIQLRYPKNVSQKEDSKKSTWENLDNIMLDDWDDVASTYVSPGQKPSAVTISDFNFNIPDDARVSEVVIEHDFHKESSQKPIEIEPPLITLMIGDNEFEINSFINADIYPADRSVVIPLEDILGEDVKGEDFKIKFEFPENINNDGGLLFFDFVRVRLVFEIKRYLLTCGETNSYFPTEDKPIQLAVGDEFRYSLYFKNVNGVSTNRQEVKINIPEGFEILKYYFKASKINKLTDDDVDEELYEDEFDEKTQIWRPSVRGKGSAAIRLVLKCTEEGTRALSGYNENFGVTPNFYVEVHDKDFETPPNLFDETTNVWGSELGDDENYLSMNQNIVIDVDNVSMEFKKPQEKVDNLKEYCIKWVKRELKPKNKFKALDHVSFSVHKGERVGIIGFNGAGKSTILKILSGVLKPTSGKIDTYGTIAPLLELGAGFDHNYSGRENVFLNGAILGYSREFLESKYDEIVEFSELEDFIDIPIKNYSSGMVAKLGFSVATIVEPDVLILDEVLSVGDVKFQKKSGDKLKSMMGSGVTVLLVSHATDNIRELCTRAIWLDQGKLVMDGDVDYVCDAYIEAAKKASEEQLSGLQLE